MQFFSSATALLDSAAASWFGKWLPLPTFGSMGLVVGVLVAVLLVLGLRMVLTAVPTPQTLTLRNGMEVLSFQKGETEYLEKEIFLDSTYLPQEISLRPLDSKGGAGAGKQPPIIVDVGANIGMFTLFAGKHCCDSGLGRPIVYSFEPIPLINKICSQNVERYRGKLLHPDSKIFQCGLSSEKGSIEMSFHYKFSLHSSGVPDFDKRREQRLWNDLPAMVSAYVEAGNLPKFLRCLPLGIIKSLASCVLSILQRKKQITCPLETLSSIIAEHDINRIDLLKVDCEGAEEMVFSGMSVADWGKVERVVCELESFAAVARVEKKLRELGFDCKWRASEQEANSSVTSEVSHLWAWRSH